MEEKKKLSKKNKIVIAAIVVVVVVLLMLFLPVNSGTFKDGGTKVYGALAYKVVKWKHLYSDGVDENGNFVMKLYEKEVVYWLPNSTKSLSELWEMEKENVETDN